MFPSDYMSKLVDYCMVKIYTLIKVQETNQVWSEEDDFVLEKPKLKVEVKQDVCSANEQFITKE